MRNVLAITLTVILAVSAVASADAYRFSGPTSGARYNYATGNFLGIAGDSGSNIVYAVVNQDGTISRYDQTTKTGDLTAAGARSDYIDVASQARSQGWGDYYWALYANGLQSIRVISSGGSVEQVYENTSVTYKNITGDYYRGYALATRQGGGIDVVYRTDLKLWAFSASSIMARPSLGKCLPLLLL